MLIPFRRFYYEQLNEIIHRHHCQRYRLKHCFELLAFILYALRLSICLYCVYFKSEFQYWNYDPFCGFVLKVGGDLNRLYLMLALMLVMLGIEGKYYYFLVDDIFPFKNGYSLVVENSDQVNACVRPKAEQRILFKKLFNQRLTKWIEAENWITFFPSIILKITCWLVTKIAFKLDLNFVNIDKYKSFDHSPLTWEIKGKLYLAFSIMDDIFYYGHFVISKFLS